jgi:hypothetical protein
MTCSELTGIELCAAADGPRYPHSEAPFAMQRFDHGLREDVVLVTAVRVLVRELCKLASLAQAKSFSFAKSLHAGYVLALRRLVSRRRATLKLCFKRPRTRRSATRQERLRALPLAFFFA